MKDNTPKKEKTTPVKKSTTKKRSGGTPITKKKEKSLLESNKIEDSIVNETPIVYETPQCVAPSNVIEKKKVSLWDRFVDFIINL